MRKIRRAGCHQEFKPPSNRYWRQGSLIDDQLQERNRDANKQAIAGLKNLFEVEEKPE